MAYWAKRGRFRQGKSEDIDWQSAGSATGKATRTRRQWVTKHVSGFCGSGVMMHRWKQRESAKCPRCDNEKDAKHVWVCQGEGVDAVWSCALQKLHRWMIEQKTLPNLADVTCDRLSAWRSKSLPSVEITGFLGLRGTVEAQDRVGWRA